MRVITQRTGTFYLFLLIFVSLFLIPEFVFAKSVEKEVKEFFEDTPVMVEIARCESKFQQFESDGSLLRGGFKGGMIGVFQIYETIHAKGASTLGFDLTTLEGNLGYAKHLYREQGTTPWNSAKLCWEKASTVKNSSRAYIKELEKKVKMLKKLVAKLQKLLAEKNTV